MPYNRTSPWKWAADRELASANYREWCAENAPELRAKLKEVAQKVVREAFAKADEVGGLSYLTRQQYAEYLDPFLACTSPTLTWDELVRLSGVSRRWKVASSDLEPDVFRKRQHHQLAQIMWTHEKLLDRQLLDWSNPLANRSKRTAQRAMQIAVKRICQSMTNDYLRACYFHEATDHLTDELINVGYVSPESDLLDPWNTSGVGEFEHRKPSHRRPRVLEAAGCGADDLLLRPRPPWRGGPILLLDPASTGGAPRSESRRQWAAAWYAYRRELEEELILCFINDVGATTLKWFAKRRIDWIWLHDLAAHLELPTTLGKPAHSDLPLEDADDDEDEDEAEAEDINGNWDGWEEPDDDADEEKLEAEGEHIYEWSHEELGGDVRHMPESVWRALTLGESISRYEWERDWTPEWWEEDHSRGGE